MKKITVDDHVSVYCVSRICAIYHKWNTDWNYSSGRRDNAIKQVLEEYASLKMRESTIRKDYYKPDEDGAM